MSRLPEEDRTFIEATLEELVGREVYVGNVLVGVIIGEKFHLRDELRSIRIKVVDDVAEEYMRKPAEFAPLHKELVHSIRDDGAVKLSAPIAELQRRWRNTVRIDEKLYAPDELLDRAVVDNDGMDLGNVRALVKIKRTYKGLVIHPHYFVREMHNLPETIVLPVGQLARTSERLHEIILRCSMKRLVTMPSFLKLNEKYTGAPRGRSEPTYEHHNPFSVKEWKTLDKMGAGFLTREWDSGPYTETINIHQARKLHKKIFGALISLPTSYEVDPKRASPLEYNQHLITWISYLTELHRAFGFHLTTREDCEMANLFSTAPRGPLGTSIIPDIYPISREILSLYETMSLNLSSIIYPHKKLTSSLLNALKKERSKLAKKEGIPPYLIFHNVALEAMARELPSNMEELLELPQVGPKNSEKYGATFLTTIRWLGRKSSVLHPPFSGAGNFTLLENKHFNNHPAGQELGLTNSLLLIPPNQEFSLKKSSLEVYSREIEWEKLLKVFSQGEDGPSGKARALHILGVLAGENEGITVKTLNPELLLQEALKIYRELGNRVDECKVLDALASESTRIGDNVRAESLWDERDAISKKFDLNIFGRVIGHPGYFSRWTSDVLGPFEDTLPSSRLIGISDDESPTVYFQTLDRIVAEFDHNTPDAQVNLESQLKKLFSRHPEWTEGGKPAPLSLLLKELNRSNAIRLNTVLETSDGYLICREFENHLSIPHWAPLASTPHRWYSSGNLAWSTSDLGRIPLRRTIRKSSDEPYTVSSDKSESLGLVTDIEAGFSCNHFNRTILNQSIDNLLFDSSSKSSGWRAYYIGLDTATRQINLCHLIDHLFDRRIADNKLLTALHLLLLETELRPEAETSQQEMNPLDHPIKALKQNPQWKPTRTRS